jgi:hypothetical protein
MSISFLGRASLAKLLDFHARVVSTLDREDPICCAMHSMQVGLVERWDSME